MQRPEGFVDVAETLLDEADAIPPTIRIENITPLTHIPRWVDQELADMLNARRREQGKPPLEYKDED